MVHYDYMTEYTCAQVISFDMEGNVVRNLSFMGGCNGNLKALSKILDGWTVEEIEEKLAGNICGKRPTSCMDQLAKAVRQALDGELEPADDEDDDDEE